MLCHFANNTVSFAFISQREVELNEQLQEVLNKLMEAKIGQKESEKESKFNECLNLMKQIFPGKMLLLSFMQILYK